VPQGGLREASRSQPEQVGLDVVVGAGDGYLRQHGQPPMKIQTVQVHEVWRSRSEYAAEPGAECAAVVLVVRVRAASYDAAQVVPDLAQRGVLTGNRRWLGHDDCRTLERIPGPIPADAIRMMVDVGERYQIYVIREL